MRYDDAMNTQLLRRAILNAIGTALYVMLFAWFMNNGERWFGNIEPGWVGFSMLLMLFIVSACVTASLVLLKPILLYMEGQKRQAVLLFASTVGALAIIAMVFGTIFVLQKPHDGGNNVYCTQDAKQCPDGTYVGRIGPKCEFAACPGK